MDALSVTGRGHPRLLAAARMIATVCNAALVTYGVMTIPLAWGWGMATALAVYLVAYGAGNFWLVFRSARLAADAARSARLRTGAAVLNASLPVVFVAQALVTGGVSPLEWAGALLMCVPALANWLAFDGAVPAAAGLLTGP